MGTRGWGRAESATAWGQGLAGLVSYGLGWDSGHGTDLLWQLLGSGWLCVLVKHEHLHKEETDKRTRVLDVETSRNAEKHRENADYSLPRFSSVSHLSLTPFPADTV